MRSAAVGLVCFLATVSARAEPPKTVYELSSPDVGQDWHLHAKDGTFVCALPCEASVGAHSGDYLVVHDEPKNVWRVNLPSSEDAAHVSMTARVGKGSPALGTLGDVLALTGAAAGVSGVALLVASLFQFASSACLDGCNSGTPEVVLDLEIGAPLLVAGSILAVVGLYLSDHNKPASSHIVVTPTSIAGRF